MRLKYFAAATALTLTLHANTQQGRPCPVLQSVQDAEFAPGQVWFFSTRPGEELARLTIIRVERSEKLGVLVRDHVEGILLKGCSGREANSIGHMPFQKEALHKSVVKLVAHAPIPQDGEEGYQVWRKACGGAYKVSVAEAIQIAEQTYSAGCNAWHGSKQKAAIHRGLFTFV